MISGKTGEKILLTGLYYCQEHPENEFVLLKDDTYPQCGKYNIHEAVWILKEAEKKEQEEKKVETPVKKEPDTEKEQADKKKSVSESYPNSGIDVKLFKRMGFFAAQAGKQQGSRPEIALGEVVKTTESKSGVEASDFRDKFNKRMDIVRKELEYIEMQIQEKIDLKKEFAEDLEKLQSELNDLQNEIDGYYVSLREEIKSFGKDKESLIEKRIGEITTELGKINQTYQDLENKFNEKNKKDFDSSKVQDDDKRFYYDYRDQLTSRLEETDKRVKLLDGEGLNITISRFLIWTGWVAAFVASWFFMQWKTTPPDTTNPGNVKSITVNLTVYILDSLRNFVNWYGWLISLASFILYIIVVLIIAKICYRWGVKNGFIKKKSTSDEKRKKHDEEKSIELDASEDGKLSARFQASSWYEMGIKIIPVITAVLLLIIILSLGSSVRLSNVVQKDIAQNTFGDLSDSLSGQLIGLLFPFAFAGLIFLYITKYVEARLLRSLSGSVSVTPKQNGFSWEIRFGIIVFLLLIVLLVFNSYFGKWLSVKQVGAIGFLLSVICSGFALGYGYRYISLHETYVNLVDRIDNVNWYIRKWFYPFHVNFGRSYYVRNKLHTIYLRSLDLIQARNELALRIIWPDDMYKAEEERREQEKEVNKDGEQEQQDQEAEYVNNNETKGNAFAQIIKKIVDAFRSKEIAQRKQIKESHDKNKKLEQELRRLKSDVLVIDEQIYFPEAAARVRELKLLIDEKTKRKDKMKDELDGYYKNGFTWASLNQQLDALYAKREGLAEKIQVLEKGALDVETTIQEQLTYKINCIKEGFHLGMWFQG